MRNLSSSELAQISGGRRAQPTMLGSATRNHVLKPADEPFWVWGGGGFTGATAWNFYTPPVPNSSETLGVFSMSNGGLGLYGGQAGYLGALTYNPSGSYFSITAIDTIGNFQVSGAASTNGSVGFTVKYSF